MPLAFGATKSASAVLARSRKFSRAICWRNVCSVASREPRAFVGVELDVVADGIGRPEPNHGVGREPVSGDQALQQCLSVGEQFARFAAHHVVVKDARIFPRQLPGSKKGVQSI